MAITLNPQPLGAPTITTVTRTSTSSVTVSFTAPTSTGGIPILKYTALSSTGSITASGISSPITVNGLTSGQPYTFTVQAYNGFGAGPPSSASNVTSTLSVPGAPSIQIASQFSYTNSVSIFYSAPADDGGSTITNYTVTSSPGNITTTYNQALGGSFILPGLTYNNTYTFTLTATNNIGTSAASSASSSVFISPTPGSQSFTVPGSYCWFVPSNVTSMSIVAVGAGGGGNCCGYTWKKGGGGGGLGYKNNITITTSRYTLVVGSGGQQRVCGGGGGGNSFVSGVSISGGGGGGGFNTNANNGGSYTGDGGGNGGRGGFTSDVPTPYYGYVVGGGGAGGYAGNGGRGGWYAYRVSGNTECGGLSADTGSGGGGGGRGIGNSTSNPCCFGGGVGLFGKGLDGGTIWRK